MLLEIALPLVWMKETLQTAGGNWCALIANEVCHPWTDSISKKVRVREQLVHLSIVIASASIPTSMMRIPVGTVARLEVVRWWS